MPVLPAIEKRVATAETLVFVLNAFIVAAVDAVRPLLSNPRALSVVQPGVSVKAAGSVIAHKVALGAGKTPNGWAVTDIDTNATVKRTAWDSSTISLQASADCTVQLEVW